MIPNTEMSVVLRQLEAELTRFDTNHRIRARVVGFGASKHIHPESILLQAIRVSLQSLLDNVAQKAAEPGRIGKRFAREDRFELLQDELARDLSRL